MKPFVDALLGVVAMSAGPIDAAAFRAGLERLLSPQDIGRHSAFGRLPGFALQSPITFQAPREQLESFEMEGGDDLLHLGVEVPALDEHVILSPASLQHTDVTGQDDAIILLMVLSTRYGPLLIA